MHRVAIAVRVGRQLPRVRNLLRTSCFEPVDIGQRPQLDPPRRVGFQRNVDRLAEIAVLDRQMHGPVRLGFARLAQQLDGVAAVDRHEVRILRLIGAVDLVQGERLGDREIDFLVAAKVLHLGP